MRLPSVGVDVEEVSRFGEPGPLARFCTPAELAWIDTQPDAAVARASVWCAREAAFKALSPHVPRLTLMSVEAVPGAVEWRIRAVDPTHAAWAAGVSVSVSVAAGNAMAVALAVPPPDQRPPDQRQADQPHHQE